MAKFFDDSLENVRFGVDSDYCFLCAKEASRKEPTKNYYDIVDSLKGKLLNKKVFKFTFSGVTRCICPDCISKLNSELSNKSENKKEQKLNKNTEKGDNK